MVGNCISLVNIPIGTCEVHGYLFFYLCIGGNTIIVVVVKKKSIARLFVVQGPCRCNVHIIENPKLLGSMAEEKEENSSRHLKDINNVSL
jgi:hypothetical protein